MQFSLAVLFTGAAGCACSLANPYCNVDGKDLPAFFYNLAPTQRPRYGHCYSTFRKEVQQRGTRGVPCLVPSPTGGKSTRAKCTEGARQPKEAWAEGPTGDLPAPTRVELPVPTTRRDDVPADQKAATVRSSEIEASHGASSASASSDETWATRIPLPGSPRVGGVGSLSPQHQVQKRGDSAPSVVQRTSGSEAFEGGRLGGPTSDQARVTPELPRRKPSSHRDSATATLDFRHPSSDHGSGLATATLDSRLTPSSHGDSATATLDPGLTPSSHDSRGDSSSNGAPIQPVVGPHVHSGMVKPEEGLDDMLTVDFTDSSPTVDSLGESRQPSARGGSGDSALSWVPAFEGGDGGFGSDESLFLEEHDDVPKVIGGENVDMEELSGAHGGLTMDALARLSHGSPVERWLQQRGNGPSSHASEIDPMGSPTVRTTRRSRPSVPVRPSLQSHALHEDYLRAGAGHHEPHALDRDYKCCHRPRALESAELTCRIPKEDRCDALGLEDRANGLCTPWCADALAEQQFVHEYLHAAPTQDVLTPANHLAAERVRERLRAHGHAVVEEEMDCCACPSKPGPRYLGAKTRKPCQAPAGTCEALGLRKTWAHGKGGCAAMPTCDTVPVTSASEADEYCSESEA